LVWVVSSALTWTVPFLMPPSPSSSLWPAAPIAIAAVLFALVNWLFFRSDERLAIIWPLVTLACWIAAAIAAGLWIPTLVKDVDPFVGIAALMGVLIGGGSLAGIAQSVILRCRPGLRLLWCGTSIVGWLVGWAVGSVALFTIGAAPVTGAIAGASYGILTGLVIPRISRPVELVAAA